MNKIKEIIKKIPRKIKRRLIFSIIIFWLILFLFPDVTFADAVWSESYSRNVSELVKMVSHVVYVFIWPCLVIAWTALDNSLVYGSFLHLDAALWNIWNIMKNFANFALWFLFVFTIVKNLFTWAFWWKDDPMKNAVDTVKTTLIWWVLVQMSWFLVSVMIDLSTILIYAVWWLPLSMVDSYNKDAAEIPLLEMNAEITNNDSFYYYSYWDHNYSPCYLVNKGWDADDNVSLEGFISTWYHQWEYIAWRKRLYLSEDKEFESWYCTVAGYLYSYVESTWFFCESGVTNTWCYIESGATLAEKNASYHNQMKNYLNYIKEQTWAVDEQINSCFLMSAYTVNYVWWWESWCEPLCSWYWEVSYTGGVFAETENKFTLKELLNKSKWWVWPFITMYSSILNYQELVINPGSYTVMWNLFWFLINTLFALILFIPIAILAVLLVVRVWYLWVVVAISPILVLLWFGPLKDKLKNNELIKKFGVKEVMTQIFSPVIVVFAVSLCIIFLSTIYKMKPLYEDASPTLSAFWIQCVPVEDNTAWDNSCNVTETIGQNKKCDYSILWLVTIRLNAQNYNHGKDMFVWVLLMCIATWIVRFFMKFAISMMWDKWKKLMESAQKFVTSLPIVPLPGGHWFVWLNKIWEIWPTKLLDSVSTEMERKSDELLQQRFPWAYWLDKDQVKKSTKTEVDTILDEVRAGKKYENLTEEQQTLVNNYYWWDATVAEQIVNNIYAYSTSKDNQTEIKNAITKWMEQGTHTNADALTLTASQLDMAVKNDSTWISWAGWMIWWAVHTRNWVRIVDTMPWTAEANNPVYAIVTRDEYEKHRFGDQPESLTKKDFDGRKDEDSAKYQKMNEYLEEMDKRYKELQGLQWRDDLNENEKTMLAKLRDMFDSKTLERLQWLDPAKFTQVQTQQ